MKKSKFTGKASIVLLLFLLIVSIGSSIIENPPILTDYEDVDIYRSINQCVSTIILLNGSSQCTKYKYIDELYRSIKKYDGIIRIDGKEIKFDNYFCSLDDYNIFHCVHVLDGYHKGESARCNKYGGMTCKMIKVYSKHSYSITDVSGEIWTYSRKIKYKSI